ncbi:MAG TPA: hypothetical protein VMH28_26485 [Candidatus Acidoferrales bacterium]|nr:hypothetical protein [Candidatus Acidoferrales bacterium]
MVRELRVQFRTDQLSEQERLNGVEFKATTGVEGGPYRLRYAPKKAWGDWAVGVAMQAMNARVLIKKKGAWSDEGDRLDLKPLDACSQVPPMEDKP